MGGMIALVGGDEFRPGCEEMDRAILAATGTGHLRVLVLPTAAAAENPRKAASNGVAYFSRLGANASALMALGPEEAHDDVFLSPVGRADVIYLTGGSPVHLLATLKGSPLLGKLKDALDRGAIVAGSSAGAMVMGSWMRFRRWADALGVVAGVAVRPHHHASDPARVAAELDADAPPGSTVLGIEGGTCCFGGAGAWQVLGPGTVTVYSRSRWSRYRQGESFSLPQDVRPSPDVS